jgi:hypothetical protein
MSEAPKSALEIALERLRKKDAAEGVEQQTLTDAQRAAIGEARSVYEARVAERRILLESSLRRTFDPAERDALEQDFRRDLERFETDREAKVRRIRENG